jgi:hypothetical protein
LRTDPGGARFTEIIVVCGSSLNEVVLRRTETPDMRIRDQVRPIIAEVLERNRGTRTSLRGGAFCASFECPPEGEPWVQVKTGVLNLFYPSDVEPVQNLRERLPFLPLNAVCPAWEPWKYATIEGALDEPTGLAALVEQIFLHFYELQPYAELSSEVFDMRETGHQQNAD